MAFRAFWRFRAFRILWSSPIFQKYRALKPNQRRFLIGSIGLLAFGFTLLGLIGLPILWEVHQSEINPRCYLELDCNIDGFDYDMRNNTDPFRQLETMAHVSYNFQTQTKFSQSNPINYNIFLNIDQPQYVNQAFLLIDVDDKMDIKGLNNHTYDVIKSLLSNSTIIYTNQPTTPALEFKHKSFNEFNAKNSLIFWGITGNVKLALLIVDVKNMTHVSPEYAVFQIQSFQTLMQLEQNEQDKKSNKQILALTWMGVAIVPILIGADYLARIFLD